MDPVLSLTLVADITKREIAVSIRGQRFDEQDALAANFGRQSGDKPIRAKLVCNGAIPKARIDLMQSGRSLTASGALLGLGLENIEEAHKSPEPAGWKARPTPFLSTFYVGCYFLRSPWTGRSRI